MAGGTAMVEQGDPTFEALHEQLAAYMERKGLRSTSQRRLVSEVFFRTGGHLSIEDMLALVRKQDPKVGYATVYRTLKLLVECGLANERQFDDTVTRFEVSHHDSHHDHLICLECKRIVEFEDDEIEALQETLAARHGFRLVSHKHELYGLCERCRASKNPE
jgi:Fur family ferric uptake transcriptional regulator